MWTLSAIYVADSNDPFGSPAGLAGVIAATIVTLGIVLIDKDFIKQYSTLE